MELLRPTQGTWGDVKTKFEVEDERWSTVASDKPDDFRHEMLMYALGIRKSDDDDSYFPSAQLFGQTRTLMKKLKYDEGVDQAMANIQELASDKRLRIDALIAAEDGDMETAEKIASQILARDWKRKLRTLSK